MNERIQELAEQAVFHACRELGNRKNWHQSFQEKFAELLIQECVRGINRDGWYWNSNSVEELCDKMEKHFGVE